VAAAAGCAAVTCAFATALVSRRVAAWRRWRRALAVVRDFEERFATPAERLQRVVNSLAIEMFAGLASEDASKVRMLLTCVDSLPDGYNSDAHLPIPLLPFFHASLLNFLYTPII
jgi:hexokinase